MSALFHDQESNLYPIPSHIKTPPPESDFVVTKRLQLDPEAAESESKQVEEAPQDMKTEDSPPPQVFTWMTPQQRAAIEMAKKAPKLSKDAPLPLAALDAQRRAWLLSMEEEIKERERVEGKKDEAEDKDEPASNKAQEEMWNCFMQAVRT